MIDAITPYGNIAKFAKVTVAAIFGLAFVGMTNENLKVSYNFTTVLTTELCLDSATTAAITALGSIVILYVYLRKVHSTRKSAQPREALLLLRLRKKYQVDVALKSTRPKLLRISGNDDYPNSSIPHRPS